MKEFNVLDRNLSIQGFHFLEASAGTGKTFSIEHLVCRLVIGKIAVENILVVTFTKAATKELKERIYTNLETAKNELLSNESTFDYISAIKEKGKSVVFQAVQNIEHALICFEQAEIFTIHSFCYRLLSENVFEAQLEELPEEEASNWKVQLRDLARVFLTKHLNAELISSGQLALILSSFNNNINYLCDRLIDMANSHLILESLSSFDHAYQSFLENLEKHSFPDNFFSIWEKESSFFKKLKEKEAAHLWNKILAEKTCDKAQFDRVISLNNQFLSLLNRDNLKKNRKIPEKLTLLTLYDYFAPDLLPLSDPHRLLLLLGNELREFLSKEMKSRLLLSPDEILRQVEESLQKTSFIENAASKYDAVIIDEFQDTDQRQWNIFSKLFFNRNPPLYCCCLVGDPKQSIYAFRNADLYTYLNAANVVGNLSYLSTNYRSEPELIKALNFLFSEKKWLKLPYHDSVLDYHAVKSIPEKRHQDLDDGKAALDFCLAEEDPQRERRWPTTRLERECFFPFISTEIQRLIAKDIAPDEIAILVKDRFQARRLYAYLKEKNISSSILRSESIIKSFAFDCMRDLLRAAIHCYDLSAFKLLLTSPFFHWDRSDLIEGESNQYFISVQKEFSPLVDTLQQRGFGTFFDQFLHSTFGFNQTVLHRIVTEREDSFVQALYQVAELLVEREINECLAPEAILLLLEEWGKTAEEENSAFILRSAEKRDSVQIMTMHMSKGLEFQIVFCLGLCSRHFMREEIVRVKSKQGDYLSSVESDERLSKKNIEEKDAEKMRLLYVAMTRAKQRCYLFAAFSKKVQSVAEGQAAPIELFLTELIGNSLETLSLASVTEYLNQVKHQGITYSVIDQVSSPFFEITSSVPVLVQPPHLDLQFERHYLESFSSLARLQKRDDSLLKYEQSDKRDTEEQNVHTLPEGAETGIVIHKLIERFLKSSNRDLEHLVKKELMNTHLTGWDETVILMLKRALYSPIDLGNVTFCFDEIDRLCSQVEMNFTYIDKQISMCGVIDLVFEYKGLYYIVDWKTNRLGNSDSDYCAEKLQQVMNKHQYEMQGAIYTEALKRHLEKCNRSFDQCFGGVIYFFVRGMGIYHFIPSRNLLEERMVALCEI